MRKFAVIAALSALLPGASLGASFTAIAVSGFNYSGIVPHTAAPPYSTSSSSLDGSNNALFEVGLPSTTAGGVPQGGILPYSANPNTFSFNLGPYGANNLLRINPTGSLNLVTPATYQSIAILGFTTGNNAPGSLEMVGDVTLHFSDTTTSVYSKAIDLADWMATNPLNPNVVTSAEGGLVNITAGTAAAAFQATPGVPKFYVSIIQLSVADAAKTLSAVSFSNFPFGGNGFQFVMAVDGFQPVPVVPPPTAAPAVDGWRLGLLTLLLAGAAIAGISRLSTKSAA